MRHAREVSRRSFLASCGLVVASGATTSFGQNRVAMSLANVPADHPLTPAIRAATLSAQKASQIADYAATFVKKEVVNGAAKPGRMQIKIRHEPFSLYMKFVEPHAGRELIYVAGAYSGQMQVHEGGFASVLGTIPLDPNGTMAMAESRYPVTMMGIQTLVEKVTQQWVNETRIATPTVQYYPNAKLGAKPCRAIETTHAAARQGLLFQRTRLYIDAESGLPIRLQQYDFSPTPGGQPVLVEDYAYLDLRPNLGLTNADFDTRNSAYGF